MSDFGSRNMGFFGGSTTGGGGTSTGVNGLNGTTNIGLGGTLTGNTTIEGDGLYTLYFFDFQVFDVFAQQISLTSYSGTDNASLSFNGQQIRSSTTGSQLYGLELDFTNSKFTLGDYDNVNNQFKIIVDDANTLISTTDSNGVNGLQIGGGFTNIGAFTGGYTYLGINQGSKTISTFATASTPNGLSIDFLNGLYNFGSFNTIGNFIAINDTSNSITTQTSNLLFEGASLQDNNAPTGLGVTYLLITLNGTQYSILCTETNP